MKWIFDRQDDRVTTSQISVSIFSLLHRVAGDSRAFQSRGKIFLVVLSLSTEIASMAQTVPVQLRWIPPHLASADTSPGAPRLPFHERLTSKAPSLPKLPHEGKRDFRTSGRAPIESDARRESEALASPRIRTLGGEGSGRSQTSGHGIDHETVQTLWERHFAVNGLPSRDNANAMVIDKFGNVYLTGYSESTFGGGDYLTVKYTPLGDTVWTRRFNGSGNMVDEATSIAADSSGNVLVTGYSYNLGAKTDYVTIKYDAGGNLMWQQRYSGPADSTDVASAIGADAAGNVYVTGYSYDRTNDYDILTICYTPAGTISWVQRHDGAGHGIDIPSALAVAHDGSVTVTGFETGLLSGFDYTTIRYLANGTEAWAAVENGTANGDDRSTAIVVDHAGNSYVSGSSMTTGSDHDYLTVTYDPFGGMIWSALYNGTGNNDDHATAITLDPQGNVIVTGFSLSTNGLYAFATVKYDTLGNERWKQRHVASSTSNAFPTSIVADTESGIILTGYVNDVFTSYSTILTLNYDPAGTEIWAKLFDGRPQSYDIAVSVLLDSGGNIYVAGTATGPSGSQDYIIIRYDASRFPLWPIRLDATGNGSEKLTAMTIDENKNVYVSGFGYRQAVAGYSVLTAKFDQNGILLWEVNLDSANSDYDTPVIFVDDRGSVYVTALRYSGGIFRSGFVTAKFDSNGVRQWVSNYQLNGQSEIKGIVADHAGNVYITGSTFYEQKLLVVKYDPWGNQQWVYAVNGRSGALGIDSSDNVCVTGTVDGIGTRADILTVKLSSGGSPRWSASYNGPGNSIDGSSAMSIDHIGNIYVAGSIYASQTGYHFATICYDSGGQERWAVVDADTGRNYSSPSAITAKANNRIYLSGRSPSLNNFLVIAYDTNGVFLWRNMYNGESQGNDDPNALAVSGSGDAYVAGTSPGISGTMDFVTLKYSRDGVLQWVGRYNSPGNGADDAQEVGVDGEGRVYVSGTSKGDYLILRYDSLGNVVTEPDYLWPSRYDGPGLSNAYASAIAVDTLGTVSVAGSTILASGRLNYLLTSYSLAGNQLPTSTFEGYGFDARSTALAVDLAGNRYVTGDIIREIGTTDIATLKYNAAGTRQWLSRYTGLADDYDFARAVALDDSGNVFVAGSSIGRGIGYDFVLLKYGNNGAQKWEARYNGSANGDDIVTGLVVDHNGYAYITGSSYGTGGRTDYATVKFNSSGIKEWTVRYDGPASLDDRAASLSVDDSGNVIVTGSSKGPSGYFDFATVKYDSGGNQQWVMRYDGSGQKDDLARAIKLDQFRHIVVAGESDGGPASLGDFVTIMYDMEGTVLWTQRYDGPAHLDDNPRALVIDPGGNCYITGSSPGTDFTNDFATLKYSSDGNLEWEARYSAAPNVDDKPVGIALDHDNNVSVTGDSFGDLWSTITTISYHQTVVTIPDKSHAQPLAFELYRNYPNPFNPSTMISFDLPASSRVTLQIYDILGQVVSLKIDDAIMAAGHHDVLCQLNNLPSGVYFYEVRTTSVPSATGGGPPSTYRAVHKMLLMK